jgi:hypothetical protein
MWNETITKENPGEQLTGAMMSDIDAERHSQKVDSRNTCHRSVAENIKNLNRELSTVDRSESAETLSQMRGLISYSKEGREGGLVSDFAGYVST